MGPISKRIRRNVSFKFAGEVVSRLLTFAFFIYAARRLGEMDFGRYSFAYSFCMFFVIFADLGLNSILIRDVAASKDKTRRHFENVTAMKLVLSALALLLINIVIRALRYPSDMVRITQLMAFVAVGVAFLDYVGALFTSHERIEYESLVRIINKLLISGLGIYVLFLGLGLESLVITVAFSYVPALIIAAYLLYTRICRFSLGFDFRFWKNMIVASLPLALSTVFVMVYFRADIVMLSLIRGDNAEIGWYSAGVRLIDAVGLLPFLIVGGLFPIFSDLYRNDLESMYGLYRKSFKYMFVVGSGLSLGILALSSQVTDLIYGSQYSRTSIALQILALSIPFMFIDYLLLHVLTVTGKQRSVALCTGICVPINIGMNLILLPRYGYIGAAVSTVITEITLFVLALHFVSKYLIRLEIFKIVAKPLISALATFLVLSLLAGGYNLFLLSILGLVVYVAALYGLRAISVEEWRSLREFFRI